MKQLLLNPNGFAKTKAGGHFLFFGQTCRKLIKRTNVALAHNSRLVTLDAAPVGPATPSAPTALPWTITGTIKFNIDKKSGL